MHRPSVFASFFQGGFECSMHRLDTGRRLDLIAATRHDSLAALDYEAMLSHGLRTVRDGLRWHLIENDAGEYDWSSFLPMLRCARESGVEVIWDLCHYGWPDAIDIWHPRFVERFARFAGATARLVRDEGIESPFYCPVNEISYWAWAGGDMGHFNPCARGRGGELKRQLIRAAIAATDAILEVDPGTRLVSVDPLIHVTSASEHLLEEAGHSHLAQFEAWDMLTGRQAPELGGQPRYLDIIGVNYYPHNQWFLRGPTIPHGHPRYRPFRDLLADVHARYGAPILIAETGAEAEQRASWLEYIGAQVVQALEVGLPIEGACLYPVVDYPGWCNNRHCETGLLGLPSLDGQRSVHPPLARELLRQQARMRNLFSSEPTDTVTI